MNSYLSSGFVLLFFVVGYFGINNTTAIISSSNLITAGVMVSLETIVKDIYYRNNYHQHHYNYLNDKDHLSLDFYNIPLANAQEQQTEENNDINNNNNNN